MNNHKNKNCKTEFSWKVKISFHPFENDIQRNQAYLTWVRAFLKGVSNKQLKKKK
jgi:hypothetical protein